MLKYALKYNIAKIVPLHECSYFYTRLPEKATNLSPDLLLLNYRSRSPFPQSRLFTYIHQKVHLSIWFTLLKAYSALFVIPEGFLVYQILLKRGDGLYVLALEDGKNLIVHIEDTVLKAQYILPSTMPFEQLEHQYGQKVTHLSGETYRYELDAVLNDPKSLVWLRHFGNFRFSKEKLAAFFNDRLYYPLVFVIILYMLISFYQSRQMEQKIETLTQTYNTLKSENSKLKMAVRSHNETVQRLQEFVQKELRREDPLRILYALRKVVHEGEDAKITYVTIVQNQMELRLETKESAMTYFNRLDALGFFQNIIIRNTYKKKNGLKTYVYLLTLKVPS